MSEASQHPGPDGTGPEGTDDDPYAFFEPHATIGPPPLAPRSGDTAPGAGIFAPHGTSPFVGGPHTYPGGPGTVPPGGPASHPGAPSYPGGQTFTGDPSRPGTQTSPGAPYLQGPTGVTGAPFPGPAPDGTADAPVAPGGPGPSRRTWGVALGLAAGASALVFGVAGAIHATVDGTVSPTASGTATDPGTTAAPAGGTTTSGDASASTSTTQTWSWTPTGYVEDPSAAGYDFGMITAVSRKGDEVVVTFDRAYFLTGDEAEEYYDEHPGVEELDYALVNDNSLTRRFSVVPAAEVFAGPALGGSTDVSETEVTLDSLVTRLETAIADDRPVWVWMRHRDTLTGPVSYVAEQYLP